MKLITYNFLTSKAIRGVKVGFPLILNINQKEEVTTEFNAEFITRLLPKLSWEAVRAGAEKVGHSADIPDAMTDALAKDTEFLSKLHHILMEIDIVDGYLQCPETGRKFDITDGIPNMLLNEDEV